MTKRLRLLGATLFALYCSAAFGVGLGDIELKSALNQRFDAEIVLTNVGALEQDEIIANLASQKDFERVGIERTFLLTDLRFTIREREDGEMIIHITSSRPIIEPFLNFIVQAVWPTGRILREYTVLLDPPIYGTDGVEMIQPGGTAEAPSTESESSSRNRMRIPPGPGSGGMAGGITDMTSSGDTLWSIASRMRPSNVSVQQTMLAIQRDNPEAFINDNINLLKAGYVLRIPDVEDIRAQSQADALAEVQFQNDEFESYRAEEMTQLDARRTAGRSSSRREVEEDGELKLIASEDGASGRGGDDGLNQELESALVVAREDLDRARRANSEMGSKVRDLEEQMQTLEGLIKAKDDQLATLRAELQRQQSAPQPSTPPVTTQQSQSSSLLSNPMVLGGIGLVAVLLVAGVLILMRRRKQSDELEDDDFPGVMMAADDDDVPMAMDDDEGLDLGDDEDDEEVTQETSDVIGEAEIYIAYGRFPQAISFLQQAIENEPGRSDIQLKLLEVYVQTEDATAFNIQFDQLKALGDDEATNRGRELQEQIPGAVEADTDPVALGGAGDAAADDDDMSFDLDDMGAETEDDELSLDSGDDELSLDEAMELGDADLDLDLDAADDAVAEEAAADELSLDDDLDLDLGGDDLDLDLGDDDLDLGGDDDAIELDLGDDDDDAIELDLGDDDDDIDLGLGDDDGIELDLGDDDDDDAITLDLGDDDDDALDLGDELDLAADDDDGIELDLGDDDAIELDLGDDDELELDLGGDDEFDLSDDDGLDLGDLDDDLGELNLDDDASSKLDLARAYIEMGDEDGAKSLLQEVVSEGSDTEIGEANELLEKIG